MFSIELCVKLVKFCLQIILWGNRWVFVASGGSLLMSRAARFGSPKTGKDKLHYLMLLLRQQLDALFDELRFQMGFTWRCSKFWGLSLPVGLVL